MLTPYDASYLALAEMLGTALLTVDRRLARARMIRCSIELAGT
jgi:predicted nucleic acid-binding protein